MVSLVAERRACGLQELQPVASAVAAPGLSSTGLVVVAQRLSYSMECGTFPDQELNLCLLHWQADSSPLSPALSNFQSPFASSRLVLQTTLGIRENKSWLPFDW